MTGWVFIARISK